MNPHRFEMSESALCLECVDATTQLPTGACQSAILEQRWQRAHLAGTALTLVHLRIRELEELGRIFGDDIQEVVLRRCKG